MQNPADTLAQLTQPFNFFQIAYVTTDVDRAVSELGRLYGIERFKVMRDLSLDTGAGFLQAHFALAFIRGQQIEVIQPLGGRDALYREALPSSGFAIQLHHFAHLVTDAPAWQRLQDAMQATGRAIPVKGVFLHEGTPLMHFWYLDTRDTLGHYLELMYQTDAGRDMFADVPRYP
jgi:hypothetical protein